MRSRQPTRGRTLLREGQGGPEDKRVETSPPPGERGDGAPGPWSTGTCAPGRPAEEMGGRRPWDGAAPPHLCASSVSQRQEVVTGGPETGVLCGVGSSHRVGCASSRPTLLQILSPFRKNQEDGLPPSPCPLRRRAETGVWQSEGEWHGRGTQGRAGCTVQTRQVVRTACTRLSQPMALLRPPSHQVARGLLDGVIPQSLRHPGHRCPRSAFRKQDPCWGLGAGPGGKPHTHGLASVLLRLHLPGAAGLVG